MDFNAAGGVLAATLRGPGLCMRSFMPPAGGGGGDACSPVSGLKGREDEAWYGAKHLQPMIEI